MTSFIETGLRNMDKGTADLERANSLFFFSFRLSQGLTALQEEIFKWLKIKYPDIVVDFEKLKPLAIEKIGRMFAGEGGVKHKPMTDIEPAIDVEIAVWQRILAEETVDFSEEDMDALLSDMLDNFMKRDYKYLTGDGRPGPKNKFFSFVCSYILLGQPSGTKEYDEMLKSLREHLIFIITQTSSSYSYQSRLKSIIGIHNENYPDKQVHLEFPVK